MLSLLCATTLAHALPESFSAGRVAVITGAASGLGKSAALKCAELGMRVALADIDEVDLAATANECAAVATNGAADVIHLRTDVSSERDVKALKDAVYDQFGECGFLLNNAGTGIGSTSALKDMDGWRTNLEVNLFGALNVLQAFVPSMLEQGTHCTLVNTGSKQGLTCPPGNLAYNVGKAGIKVITEGLQHELRGSEHAGRVTAHLFVPGWVNTMLARNYFRELKGESFDPEADVPWSTDKPASGAWMPDQTIEYLFEKISEGKFYIICPDNDVSEEMDKKRIAWAAGDIIERDVPLSRWHPDYKDAFTKWSLMEEYTER